MSKKQLISGVILGIILIIVFINIGIYPEESFILIGAIFSILVVILLVLVGILFYMLPTLIGVSRKHSNLTPIVLVNIFFGWSFIGWIISLVWSFTDNTN